ncbi:MarR family transcriptional regulator [Mycobacterium sp. NPDC050551]|uniref:MarR family transcriptional regulator n=1 Tax=Mycobacterium sp. NPDC050551 TaxID=3155407 RepID=UPI00342772D3
MTRSPLIDSTTMLLIGAGRAAQRRLEDALAEHGLTLRHLGALGHLSRAQDLSYSDLARRARITPQSMQATMIQLADAGAVVIESRGRASYPRLTAHGRHLLTVAADAAADCDRALAVPDALRDALAAVVRREMFGE